VKIFFFAAKNYSNYSIIFKIKIIVHTLTFMRLQAAFFIQRIFFPSSDSRAKKVRFVWATAYVNILGLKWQILGYFAWNAGQFL